MAKTRTRIDPFLIEEDMHITSDTKVMLIANNPKG
jgi:hypothetical protein